jgi:ubiquinone/menaquinone biosynthesis C-methylase UbiE
VFTREPILINERIHSFEFDSNISIDHHSDAKGSKIDKLAKVKYSLPYWESGYYIRKLTEQLEGIDRESRILDAGCGDGRFTMMLLDLGFSKIYALDSNLDSLLELDNQLVNRGATDKVVLVHANVSDLPFQNVYFDAALSIGVLYYLNDGYEDALNEITRVLNGDALLLETEPDQIGCAVKGLIFDGLDSFLRVAKEHIFLEYFDGEPLELRCFSDQEMHELHEKAGVPVREMKIISLFPSLLTIGQKKNLIKNIDKLVEFEKQAKEAFDIFDGSSSLAKHKLWICKKT